MSLSFINVEHQQKLEDLDSFEKCSVYLGCLAHTGYKFPNTSLISKCEDWFLTRSIFIRGLEHASSTNRVPICDGDLKLLGNSLHTFCFATLPPFRNVPSWPHLSK